MLLFLWACTAGENAKDDSAPALLDDSGGITCTGTPPVLDAVIVEDGGQITIDAGTFDSLLVAGQATDADKDLYIVDMDVWFDDIVDGTVDTSGDALSTEPYRLIDYEPCEAPSAQYGLKLPVNGSLLVSGTTYEFAVIFYDSIALASEIGIGTGTAP